MLAALGDRYPAVLADHHRLIREAVAGGGGVEVDTAGDGFFAVFASARSAVAAALTAQRLLADHRWPEGHPLKVRMGLHTGEATRGSTGYVGMDVHRAARIMGSAHGGRWSCPRPPPGLLRDDQSGWVVGDLGRYRLKDLPTPEHLFQVSVAGDQFPPLRGVQQSHSRLPPRLTSFVGRQTECAEIAELLTTNRLVTVTGAGGSGKTRLALEMADEQASSYPDGVWLVPLAAIVSGEGVV